MTNMIQQMLQQLQSAQQQLPPAAPPPSQAPPNQMQNTQQMQQMQQMMQQMQQSQQQQSPASSEKRKLADDELIIPSSCTYIWQIPIKRQQHGIEFVHTEFDCISTGTWEMPALMRLLWLLAGVQPNMQVVTRGVTVWVIGNGICLSK